jgi:hypothetical protein
MRSLERGSVPESRLYTSSWQQCSFNLYRLSVLQTSLLPNSLTAFPKDTGLGRAHGVTQFPDFQFRIGRYRKDQMPEELCPICDGSGLHVFGVFGTTGRKVRLSVLISWIAQGPQSSPGDDVGHCEGISSQQVDVIVNQGRQSRRILVSDQKSLFS